MDANFNNRRPKKTGYIILIGIALVIMAVIVVIAFFMNGSNMITPVPPQPSFKVIFISPTLGVVTPTSTPSATIKPSATPKPAKPTSPPTTSTPSATIKITPTPSVKITVTPTSKASPTPTKKP